MKEVSDKERSYMEKKNDGLCLGLSSFSSFLYTYTTRLLFHHSPSPRRKMFTAIYTCLVAYSFITLYVEARHSVWSWEGDDVPPERRSDGPYTPSACGNGGYFAGSAEEYAFACPHQGLLSDDMILAAKFDGNYGDFAYATAGSSSDELCGTCYQVQLLDAERQWRDDYPQAIVQVVNSGFDVMRGQLDLFIGGGGFGHFTALNSDCSSLYCNGGACKQAMYDGSFEAWTYSPFPAPNPCYGGGLRLLNETSAQDVLERCKALSGDSEKLKDKILWDTCVRANLLLFHQNFVSSNYVRVRCPKGLYMLTGMRRLDDDDDNVPDANTANELTESCRGSREGGHYCVTSMSDGCVPSCAWPGKVDVVDPAYKRVDRCLISGMPLFE